MKSGPKSVNKLVKCRLICTVNFIDTFKIYKNCVNTFWTGDADLRLYITTVQDG